MELRGRRALVTGGARRVGRAVALALAREGCAVALHYGRSGREAEETARAVRGLGVECLTYQADLARPREVWALARAVLRRPRGCPLLVNSASVFPRVALEDSGAADLDLPYAVNLRAPALLTRALGGELKRLRRPGRIVNIADSLPPAGRPEALGYSLSKAGLLHLTRVSAAALAPWVLVNSVSPGSVLMPPGHGPGDLRSSRERSLLKRIGSPGEVAAAVVLALRSDFMTGADLRVDGGRALV